MHGKKIKMLFAVARSEDEKSRPTLSVDIKNERTMRKIALYSHVTHHHFSFWNGLAMKEDMLFDYEHFALAGSQ